MLLVLLALIVAGLVVLDTGPGHRFIVDRLAQMETATGLRIRVARIEGSIYGEARLKGVAVADPQGTFLTSPEITIDWALDVAVGTRDADDRSSLAIEAVVR